MLKAISRFVNNIVNRRGRRKDPRILQAIEDLINPRPVDWELDEDDHKVIASYVALFLRDNEVMVERMVVSPDLYPSLHRFMSSLKGERSWQEFMAAFDYLEDKWPELKPLIEASDTVAKAGRK